MKFLLSGIRAAFWLHATWIRLTETLASCRMFCYVAIYDYTERSFKSSPKLLQYKSPSSALAPVPWIGCRATRIATRHPESMGKKVNVCFGWCFVMNSSILRSAASVFILAGHFGETSRPRVSSQLFLSLPRPSISYQYCTLFFRLSEHCGHQSQIFTCVEIVSWVLFARDHVQTSRTLSPGLICRSSECRWCKEWLVWSGIWLGPCAGWWFCTDWFAH